LIPDFRVHTLFYSAAFCALVCSGSATAQNDATPAEITRIDSTPPVLIGQVVPRYPPNALVSRREGWVAISYIVSQSGEVTGAMIEDSSGNESIETAAMRAVTKWSYAPATVGGQPVEHVMTRQIFRLQLEGAPPGASKSFVKSFRKIRDLLEARDLSAARDLLTTLRDTERRNLYEDAWFWWLQAYYLETSSGDVDEQIDALTRAVAYEDVLLEPEMFVSAAARLFVLRVGSGDYSAALQAYERLMSEREIRASKAYRATQPQLAPIVAEIERAIAGKEMLRTRGRVGVYEYWVHSLVRRSFSLANIAGSLDHLSIRCSRRNVTFAPVTGENTWTIPESYGACSVYVHGVPGTTFEFYELPAEPGAAAR
jgi:TonB family protein